MVQLCDGERAAFDVLVDELWPVILAFAERGVGGGPDAEDVAQEVFYRICSRIADFDRTRDGLSWAFGIASYEIMTLRRRAMRRREVFDEATLGQLIDRDASQEEQLLSYEMRNAMTAAQALLSAEERISLGLCEGIPSVSGPALRKRRQRALDRLRGLWRQIYGEP